MKTDREPPQQRPTLVLSADEEITLRRVAYGQSEVRVLRAADLDRLRKLFLIEDAKDGPRLTLAGRIHFASLPKGVFVGAPRHADYQSVPEALPKPSNKGR